VIERNREHSDFFIYFLSIVIIYVIHMEIIPVHCIEKRCKGLMKRTKTRISTFRAELHYKCNKCNSVYQTEIIVLPEIPSMKLLFQICCKPSLAEILCPNAWRIGLLDWGNEDTK
jgi:hypothetical protein